MNAPEEEQDRHDMAELVAGRDTALNRLMDRHGPALYRYLIRVLGREAEAADVAQETFVRVYQHRARFDPEAKFTTWLYAIATNLARNRLRTWRRHPELSMDSEGDDGEGAGLAAVLADGGAAPDQAAQARERAKAVRQAVAQLPEHLRVPLVLAEYEGRSQVEIGRILGCTAKAVEMRLYRARQELRKTLRPWLASGG